MKRIVQFDNPKGMHLRPSSALSQLCKQFDAQVRINVSGGSIDARSILEVLSAGIPRGPIEFEANGPQADEALQAIEKMLTDFRLDA